VEWSSTTTISLFFGRVAKKLSTVHFKLSVSLWQAITTLTAQVMRPLFSLAAWGGSAQKRCLVSCLGFDRLLKVLQDSADPIWSFRPLLIHPGPAGTAARSSAVAGAAEAGSSAAAEAGSSAVAGAAEAGSSAAAEAEAGAAAEARSSATAEGSAGLARLPV
jgi:hypothetical protein